MRHYPELRLCIDQLKEDIFRQMGYSEQKAESLRISHGLKAYYTYLKPFEFNLFQDLFEKPKQHIYDMGAGFTCFEEKKQQIFCCKTLNQKAYTVLVYPHPCLETSYQVIKKRLQKRIQKDSGMAPYLQDPSFDLIKHLVNAYNPLFFSAQYVVYTHKKSIEECIKSIFKKILEQ